MLNPGWMTNSEIVRAVADRPEGQYVFQQIMLPARGAEYWDGYRKERTTFADGTTVTADWDANTFEISPELKPSR